MPWLLVMKLQIQELSRKVGTFRVSIVVSSSGDEDNALEYKFVSGG